MAEHKTGGGERMRDGKRMAGAQWKVGGVKGRLGRNYQLSATQYEQL
jgi:hypothetical protein